MNNYQLKRERERERDEMLAIMRKSERVNKKPGTYQTIFFYWSATHASSGS